MSTVNSIRSTCFPANVKIFKVDLLLEGQKHQHCYYFLSFSNHYDILKFYLPLSWSILCLLGAMSLILIRFLPLLVYIYYFISVNDKDTSQV